MQSFNYTYQQNDPTFCNNDGPNELTYSNHGIKIIFKQNCFTVNFNTGETVGLYSRENDLHIKIGSNVMPVKLALLMSVLSHDIDKEQLASILISGDNFDYSLRNNSINAVLTTTQNNNNTILIFENGRSFYKNQILPLCPHTGRTIITVSNYIDQYVDSKALYNDKKSKRLTFEDLYRLKFKPKQISKSNPVPVLTPDISTTESKELSTSTPVNLPSQTSEPLPNNNSISRQTYTPYLPRSVEERNLLANRNKYNPSSYHPSASSSSISSGSSSSSISSGSSSASNSIFSKPKATLSDTLYNSNSDRDQQLSVKKRKKLILEEEEEEEEEKIMLPRKKVILANSVTQSSRSSTSQLSLPKSKITPKEINYKYLTKLKPKFMNGYYIYRECPKFTSPSIPLEININDLEKNEEWVNFKDSNIWLSNHGRKFDENKKLITTYNFNIHQMFTINTKSYPLHLLMAEAFVDRNNNEEIIYVQDDINIYRAHNLKWFKIPDSWNK